MQQSPLRYWTVCIHTQKHVILHLLMYSLMGHFLLMWLKLTFPVWVIPLYFTVTVWGLQETLAEFIEKYSGLCRDPPGKRHNTLFLIETHKEHKFTYQLIYTEPYVLCLGGWGCGGGVAALTLSPISAYACHAVSGISPEPCMFPQI